MLTAQTRVELFILVLTTAYFIAWAASYLAMSGIATVALWRHRHRQTRRAMALVEHVPLPLISVVVPAYNEELTIVETVRALLALEYEAREIVIVNDGSGDGTLAMLQQTFALLPAPLAYMQPLPAARVRGVYRSTTDPALVVVDKENGGCKADATNAGINAASGELFLVIDADTVLEPDALARAVLPFLEDPRTIAVGANVAVANGCRIEHGQVTDVALPRSWLARFQVVEYMRAFMLFRVACASVNGLLILSGAFGLFRRDAVIAVGGFDRAAIGEDMDLTLRLHRYFRARRQPFRIAFDSNPLCCTQVPEDWASLRSQRWRWRRGLLQVLWRYRGMIGNPRYGAAGLCTLPYTALFEGCGPLLECVSYAVAIAAWIAGVLDWQYCAVLVIVWSLLGTSVTMSAVLLHDIATKRYMERGDLARLVVVALLENVGYRQLNSCWSVVGTMQAISGTGGWGTMKRRTFAGANVPSSR